MDNSGSLRAEDHKLLASADIGGHSFRCACEIWWVKIDERYVRKSNILDLVDQIGHNVIISKLLTERAKLYYVFDCPYPQSDNYIDKGSFPFVHKWLHYTSKCIFHPVLSRLYDKLFRYWDGTDNNVTTMNSYDTHHDHMCVGRGGESWDSISL